MGAVLKQTHRSPFLLHRSKMCWRLCPQADLKSHWNPPPEGYTRALLQRPAWISMLFQTGFYQHNAAGEASWPRKSCWLTLSRSTQHMHGSGWTKCNCSERPRVRLPSGLCICAVQDRSNLTGPSLSFAVMSASWEGRASLQRSQCGVTAKMCAPDLGSSPAFLVKGKRQRSLLLRSN